MNYKKKTLQDWNNLTEEQQTEVIMHIGTKLNKQEIWYWEGLVYNYRTLQDRINKALAYIKEHYLYEEEYDYDYEENSYLSGISDEVAKQELLDILKGNKYGSDSNE